MTTLAFIGGLGWPEILVIGLVVLLVFGPRRLPEIAEAFGSSIKKFRRATQDVKDEVRREIDSSPKNDAKNDAKDEDAPRD